MDFIDNCTDIEQLRKSLKYWYGAAIEAQQFRDQNARLLDFAEAELAALRKKTEERVK